MPSKPVGGRKLAGGFDPRPPPLVKAPSDQRRSAEPGRSGRGKGPIRAPPTASATQVFRCCLRPAPDKSSDRPPEERTSFRTPSLEGQEEAAWSARWTTNGEEAHHVGGFARGVLAHCEAWNLSGRSVAAEAAPSGRRWWFALTLVAPPPSGSRPTAGGVAIRSGPSSARSLHGSPPTALWLSPPPKTTPSEAPGTDGSYSRPIRSHRPCGSSRAPRSTIHRRRRRVARIPSEAQGCGKERSKVGL